jgi:hypothetical protein
MLQIHLIIPMVIIVIVIVIVIGIMVRRSCYWIAMVDYSVMGYIRHPIRVIQIINHIPIS